MLRKVTIFVTQNNFYYKTEKQAAREIKKVKENVKSIKTDRPGQKQTGETKRKNSQKNGNITEHVLTFELLKYNQTCQKISYSKAYTK